MFRPDVDDRPVLQLEVPPVTGSFEVEEEECKEDYTSDIDCYVDFYV